MILPSLRLDLKTYLRRNFCRRFISHKATSPDHSIYVSKSTNPYFNLTYEDWLFRHKSPEKPLILVYRDDPCVVIGRNQNPWKEVNFQALRSRPDVTFIRRRSGGGTVYHDLGNSNFSIHLPRKSFDRHATAQVILRAIHALGIDAHVNERNDICVGPYKISSAYKIVNARAYHHGTMLLSTRLDDLGDLLRVSKDTMIAKGVASVRSPVCNLQQFSTSINHQSFTDAVVNQFRKEYGIDEEVVEVEENEELLSLHYVKRGMAELRSWEWLYGQTPEFTYSVSQSFSWGHATVKIVSKHALILDFQLDIANPRLDPRHAERIFGLAKSFQGKRYGVVEHIPCSHFTDGPISDVISWIKTIMA